MKMAENEREIIRRWGCPDYGLTIQRLGYLCALAVDESTKKEIFSLRSRLYMECTEKEYVELYHSIHSNAGYWRMCRKVGSISNRQEEIKRSTRENIMSKLKKYEKETIILTSEGDNTASIYTFNTGLKRRLAAYCAKYPRLCVLEVSTPEGSVTYRIDKKRLSIRLIPPYSDERRASARAYAKEHGFRTVRDGNKTA